MKTLHTIIMFTLFLSLLPMHSQANTMRVELDSKTNIPAPFEDGIHLRKLDLQKKLFKEETEKHRTDFHKAREAFKNSSSDTRNILKSEFRARFHERFKFVYDKLSEFQTRMQTRIDIEKNAGVETEKAQAKLDTSVSFMTNIETNIGKLKTLLDERYSEDERETKKEEARKLVETLKTDIRASHLALKESFKELRTATSTKLDVESSTTIELNNN